MDAGKQLKRIFGEGFNATTPTDAASTTGSVAAMVKALVAQIIGTTNPSAVTADAAGSVLERLQYVTDNTGIGLKKVQNAGYAQLPASGSAPTTVTSGAGAYTDGSYAQNRAASGNAIYIVGYSYTAPGSPVDGTITVATGGSGSETAVSELPIDGAAGAERRTFWLPNSGFIAVAASTRIALKAKDSAGSTDWKVRLITIDQANVVPA